MTDKEALTLICLGDSLTAGGPGFSGYGTWSGNIESQYGYWLEKHLEVAFPEKEIDVLNFGVGGDRLWQILYRFNRDVLRLVPEPDIVLVMGGVNDILGHGSHETGVKKDLEEIYDTIYDTEALLVPIEIGPVTATRRFVNRIRKSNKAIRELAELFEVPFVPLYDALANKDGFGLNQLYDVGDGVHYNVHGYKKIGEAIFEVLKPVLEARFNDS